MTNYNERLDEILNSLANSVEWCVNPEALSGATIDREREADAINEAKQAILDWHNKQVEETKRAERRKGVRDGYNYALTYVDLATDLNDAYRRVSEGHKKAMERVDD